MAYERLGILVLKADSACNVTEREMGEQDEKQVLSPQQTSHTLTRPLTAFLSFPRPRELFLKSFCRSNSMSVGALKLPLILRICPCELWCAGDGE